MTTIRTGNRRARRALRRHVEEWKFAWRAAKAFKTAIRAEREAQAASARSAAGDAQN